MKKIEDSLKIYSELRKMLLRGELVPRSYMKPTYSFEYECGSGSRFAISETPYVLCAKPVKFFLVSSMNICTLVRVKGLFRPKPTSEWYAEAAIFMDAFTRFIESDQNCQVFYDPEIDKGNTKFIKID